MKFEFTEREWGIELTMIPETLKEVSQLSRYARNASAKKPDIYLSFSDINTEDVPRLYFSHSKIAKQNQRNSIKPNLK